MEAQCSTDAAARVIAAARSWIGTPYHHQMAIKGAGCDCLGLVRGVYAEIYGHPSEKPPPYTRDWGEASGAETLLEAAARHLFKVLPLETSPSLLEACPREPAGNGNAQPGLPDVLRLGDVLIFRMRRGAMAKHAAILATPETMIHAFENNPVCEVPFSPWWRSKLAAAFRFPQAGSLMPR